MTIKAIETRYKGYMFRSRLEARWAVFFDELGIEWQYEPQGFERTDSDGNVERYLPDFYLPKLEVWVEVKGDMSEEAACRLAYFLDWGSALPGFNDCAASSNETMSDDCRGHVLLLGEIPEPVFGIQFHGCVGHHKGLRIGLANFTIRTRISNGSEWPAVVMRSRDFHEALMVGTGVTLPLGRAYIDGVASSASEIKAQFDTRAITVKTQMACQRVVDAYAAARSARFEHGEIGALRR